MSLLLICGEISDIIHSTVQLSTATFINQQQQQEKVNKKYCGEITHLKMKYWKARSENVFDQNAKPTTKKESRKSICLLELPKKNGNASPHWINEMKVNVRTHSRIHTHTHAHHFTVFLHFYLFHLAGRLSCYVACDYCLHWLNDYCLIIVWGRGCACALFIEL